MTHKIKATLKFSKLSLSFPNKLFRNSYFALIYLSLTSTSEYFSLFSLSLSLSLSLSSLYPRFFPLSHLLIVLPYWSPSSSSLDWGKTEHRKHVLKFRVEGCALVFSILDTIAITSGYTGLDQQGEMRCKLFSIFVLKTNRVSVFLKERKGKEYGWLRVWFEDN